MGKASWNQALSFGDFNTRLNANYDYNANKDFLKEVSLSGDIVEASTADGVRVSYEVKHNFADSNTNVKLSANMHGTNPTPSTTATTASRRCRPIATSTSPTR